MPLKWGYKYCNALFELKNTPKDLVYWRMKVLDSLYCNIDLISDDSELIALYRLTNSWIKEYIENDREYNRLETLEVTIMKLFLAFQVLKFGRKAYGKRIV